MLHKTVYTVVIISSIFFFWSLNTGCAKEYSYEGGDTLIVSDTLPPANSDSTFKPWICPACISQDEQIESKWSFHDDSSFACGIIDTAIVNADRTAFTFFGPSSCSNDTGIIVDAYLDNVVLNKDLHNVISQQGAFYYYDNVAPSYILISHTANFTIKIDSYIQQTHLATGTFSGTVYRPNGTSRSVTSGKFKVRLY
jgi:hypothetical protein